MDKASAATGERKVNHDDTWLNYNHARHGARDCPHPQHEREHGSVANVVKAEEEVALFLAHKFLELDAEGRSGKAQASTSPSPPSTSTTRSREPMPSSTPDPAATSLRLVP